MKEKAKANLLASKQLLTSKLPDPAASRLYYALFQAGVHSLVSKGKQPRDLSEFDRWKHATLCNNSYLCRGNRRDSALFRSVLSLRETADYQPEPVEPIEVAQFLPDVESFVQEVTR